MQIYKMEFTLGELRSLPPTHAGFLFASCLSINDISVIQKVFLMAQNTRAAQDGTSDDRLREIALGQSVVIERNLGAKVLEYLKLIGDYKKQCKRAKDTSMLPFIEKADAVASKLKSGESYDLAVWYRNNATSHYNISLFKSLFHNDAISNDDTKYTIYLHEREGNTSYLLGEQMLLAKLSENGRDPIEQINMFGDWVLETSKTVMKLHNEFCKCLFERYFPSKKIVESPILIEPQLIGNLIEDHLPLMWNFDVSINNNQKFL